MLLMWNFQLALAVTKHCFTYREPCTRIVHFGPWLHTKTDQLNVRRTSGTKKKIYSCTFQIFGCMWSHMWHSEIAALKLNCEVNSEHFDSLSQHQTCSLTLVVLYYSVTSYFVSTSSAVCYLPFHFLLCLFPHAYLLYFHQTFYANSGLFMAVWLLIRLLVLSQKCVRRNACILHRGKALNLLLAHWLQVSVPGCQG